MASTTTLNTKNIVELQQAFNQVITDWKENKHNPLVVESGIEEYDVHLEDGLPWIEIQGEFNKSSAKALIQDLADAMNICVLFNRLEAWSDTDVLYGVMDISPEKLREDHTTAVPAYADDPDAKEFMEDYGKAIYPAHYQQDKHH
jgi:hypothetical protein